MVDPIRIQQAKNEVRRACDALNDAIQKASEVGLSVEADVQQSLARLTDPHSTPVIVVRMAHPEDGDPMPYTISPVLVPFTASEAVANVDRARVEHPWPDVAVVVSGTDTLAPAFTLEEWLRVKDDSSFRTAEITDGWVHDGRSDQLPRIIALAYDDLPDDSPYKITRADAAMLTGLASALRFDYHGSGDEELDALAAKLAAFLPPE